MGIIVKVLILSQCAVTWQLITEIPIDLYKSDTNRQTLNFAKAHSEWKFLLHWLIEGHTGTPKLSFPQLTPRSSLPMGSSSTKNIPLLKTDCSSWYPLVFYLHGYTSANFALLCNLGNQTAKTATSNFAIELQTTPELCTDHAAERMTRFLWEGCPSLRWGGQRVMKVGTDMRERFKCSLWKSTHESAFSSFFFIVCFCTYTFRVFA